MFQQNNVILMVQLGSFLSYFNVNIVGGKSWNILYRPMSQQVMQRTVVEHYQVHISAYLTMHGTRIKIIDFLV
jgi:hypothetical protein